MILHLLHVMLGIGLMLVVVIGMHELGHAALAYWFGVKIARISIGFGRPLCRWKDKRGIEWVWAIWPIGGYVKLLNTRIDPQAAMGNLGQCFDKKSVFVRCCILLAGAASNFFVAGILFTGVFMLGFPIVPSVIQEITPNSTAALAGLRARDTIIQMDGHAVTSWQEVNRLLIRDVGKPRVSLIVQRERHKRSHQLWIGLTKTSFNPKAQSLLTALGIQPQHSPHSSSFHAAENIWFAMRDGVSQVVTWIYLYGITLGHIVSGDLPLNLLIGPLGLLWVTAHSLSQSLVIVLSLFGLLSVAVGVVNLLPIPGLDGGSIVYCIIEKWRGKPLSLAIEILLYQLAQIWLGLFMLKLIMNDILFMLQ